MKLVIRLSFLKDKMCCMMFALSKERWVTELFI